MDTLQSDYIDPYGFDPSQQPASFPGQEFPDNSLTPSEDPGMGTPDLGSPADTSTSGEVSFEGWRGGDDGYSSAYDKFHYTDNRGMEMRGYRGNDGMYHYETDTGWMASNDPTPPGFIWNDRIAFTGQEPSGDSLTPSSPVSGSEEPGVSTPGFSSSADTSTSGEVSFGSWPGRESAGDFHPPHDPNPLSEMSFTGQASAENSLTPSSPAMAAEEQGVSTPELSSSADTSTSGEISFGWQWVKKPVYVDGRWTGDTYVRVGD